MTRRARSVGPAAALCWLLTGCASPMFEINDRSNVDSYVVRVPAAGPGSETEPSGLRFKPGLCDGSDLRPEQRTLDEANLIEFLNKQQLDVRVERPRSDLIYLIVGGAGTNVPVRLRVAVLKNPDEAGTELHNALLQHGSGAWGVRRANLAVLGAIGSL
ncbi:MAG TPA: hypothetical protein VIW29_21665, partial [Polyangiaceae bacterium]